MLVTIREYAADTLARSGRREDVRRRHAEYYADFARRASEQLRGSHQLTWLDRLEIEHDNLRSALAWSLEGRPDSDDDDGQRLQLGLRLVNALSWFWYGHGHAADGRRWLELAIDQTAGEEGPDLARAVHGLGVLLLQQGEYERARAALEQNLAVWRRLGDSLGLTKGLNSLGAAYRTLGQFDLARRELGESIQIARTTHDNGRLSAALSNLAVVEIDVGQPERAIPILQEAIELDRELGDSWAIAVDQGNLAGAMIRANQGADAHRLLCSVSDAVIEQGDVELTSDTLEHFAAALAELGDDERSARLAGAADRLRETTGMPLSAPDRSLLEHALGPARARTGNEVGAGVCRGAGADRGPSGGNGLPAGPLTLIRQRPPGISSPHGRVPPRTYIDNVLGKL